MEIRSRRVREAVRYVLAAVVGFVIALWLVGVVNAAAEPPAVEWPQVCRVVMPEDLDHW